MIGIPGGIAYQTDRGIAIWDARSNTITREFGTSPAYVADAHGQSLAWCDQPCEQMHITHLDGNEVLLSLPAGTDRFDERRQFIEHVEIAVGARVTAARRTEHEETHNAVPSTDRTKPLLIDRKIRHVHRHQPTTHPPR